MAPAAARFGDLLRDWRGRRGWSQLHLAAEAGVSPRHLSFLETGRSLPSREMVMSLARVLELPLRERNQWLTAAGYAPVYRETPLDAPEMADMLRALSLMLRQAEPMGAIAFDRSWDILMANAGYLRLLRLLGVPATLAPYTLTAKPRPNAIEMLFATELWRHIANWDLVGPAILARLERELRLQPSAVAEEALRRHRARWGAGESPPTASLVLPIEIRAGGIEARLFSTVATLGTAQDVTLAELRVELFFPMDAATEALARRLAEAEP